MLFKGNSSRLELLIGKIHAHKDPSQEEHHHNHHHHDHHKSKEALGTGSSSWHSEDGVVGAASRRGGGETPSSCATPTSASFPSEPEVDGADGTTGGNGVDANNSTAPYPCQFCERTFPRLSYLKKHEQSHGDQMPYRCSWCARLFKHKRSRDRHVKLHTGDRRYRCSHCEAAFSRSDHLKIHMKTHDTQKPYQCTACSRGYNTAAALTSHMQSHKKHNQQQQQQVANHHHSNGGSNNNNNNNTNNNNRLLQDVDYGRRSVSSHSTSSPPIASSPSPSLNLTTMNTPKGSRKTPPGSNNGGSTSTTPLLNSPLKLACMYCTRDSFSCMQQLQVHVHTMHQAILNKSSPSLDPHHRQHPASSGVVNFSSRDRTLDRSSGNDISSPSSSSAAAVMAAFAKDHHQHHHHEEKQLSDTNNKDYENAFTCQHCTMKFSTLESLRDHSISIHRTEVSYGSAAATLMMCPLCGIPCTSAAAYAEHYVLQHCENRRIVPPDNGIISIQASYHQPDAKVNGTYDPKRTREQINKNRDQQQPQQLTETAADLTNKPNSRSSISETGYTSSTLLCGQCDAALKDFESFREHLARHLKADQNRNTESTVATRYPCPKCDTTFQDKEEMLAHLTKHYLGQIAKEYACSACNKLYPHPDLLQRHLLDSHAHHLYRCALCRDTFDSRVAIQVHFAVKHSHECKIYRCNTCTKAQSNENSAGNTPSAIFRSEGEMANHVRTVHAPLSVLNSPETAAKSPASTPGIMSGGNTASAISGARCVFCGICCTSELELQLHLATHSSSLYRCPVCREGFAVEFLLDRHIAQVHQPVDHQHHHQANARSTSRENGRLQRISKSQEEMKGQKRGRSPASSNNNSVSQRDNNNKRMNYGISAGGAVQQCELCERGEFANDAELQAHKKLAHQGLANNNKIAGVNKSSLSSLSMTCAYCGEVCRSRNELESHVRMQHASSSNLEVSGSGSGGSGSGSGGGGAGGRHKCNICDEVCPSSVTLAEHKLQKHCKIQVSDTCVVCRASLTGELQFLEHVQRHSLDNVDPQQQQRLNDSALPPYLPAPCVVCRQTLISDLECRLHARHHLQRSNSNGNNTTSPGTSSSPSPSGNNNHRSSNSCCCLCLREFVNGDFVSLPPKHVNGAAMASFPTSNLKVCKACYLRHSHRLPILTSPYEQSGRVVAKCEQQRLPWLPSTKDSSRWEASRDTWESEGPVKSEDHDVTESSKRCEECGVKFENSEEANRHRANAHVKIFENGSNGAYTCIQCQVSFPSEALIQQHVRKEHLETTIAAAASGTGSNDALRCHLCLFEANSTLLLQSHLIEHTFAGCTALSCYICQALFTAPTGLQNHLLQEHGLGARPYDCSKCTSKFFFRAELDHHVLTYHRSTEMTSFPSDTTISTATTTITTTAATTATTTTTIATTKLSNQVKTNENVTIKEEISQEKPEEEEGGEEEEEEEEEEEVNVDGQGELEEELDKQEENGESDEQQTFSSKTNA